MQVQRWATTVLGLAVVVLAAALGAKNFRAPRAAGAGAGAGAGQEPGGKAGAATDDIGTMYATAPAQPPADAGIPLLVSDLVTTEPRTDAGAGATWPDGQPVPPLPADAPRRVRFGVVLVSYDGAQPGPTGRHPAARSKAEARALADKLVATARQDFHAAVQQGDAGSADDIGRVKLGILEPGPEYVLFTLPIDGVGGPVDTPRGYWIVKRLE